MTPHPTSSIARSFAATALLFAACAVQAQMQTPPPSVPPSARPVERPAKSPLPSLPPRAAASSPQAAAPERGTPGTAAPTQSPTQLGQAQVNIPFGKGEEQKPAMAGAVSVAAPPAVAASRAKARPARKASGNELRRER